MKIQTIVRRLLLLICSMISGFFIFYTIRLLYITNGLTNIRVGGEGTYIGAVAFPVLAALFGYGSWRLFIILKNNNS